MALTATNIKMFVTGDRKTVVADVLFDNSYPTGGEPLTGAMLGLDYEVSTVIPGMVTTAASATPLKTVIYDHVNSKLLLYPTAATEATNATDQSTVRVRVTAIGKGPAVV